MSLPTPHAAGVGRLLAPGRPSPTAPHVHLAVVGKASGVAGTRMSLAPSVELWPDRGTPVPAPQNVSQPRVKRLLLTKLGLGCNIPLDLSFPNSTVGTGQPPRECEMK